MSLLVQQRSFSSGGMLIMTLVFVVMFGVIFAALSGLVSRQFHEGVLQAQDETAFQVAEAGLNYARWRLAHNPEDFSDAEQTLEDPLAGPLGTFDISIESPQEGSTIAVITSVGETAAQPSRQVTLEARYGLPSLAQYAFVTNQDVWYGGEINGPVHSNGGIRMDGESVSIMTSARETYICTPSHGCNNEEQDGIWGSGTTQELWEYPVPPIDYSSMTLDMATMKDVATDLGTYYGPSSNFGYHIVFNNDDTYSIYEVLSKGQNVYSWTPETGWEYTSHDIGSETIVESQSVPSNGVIYVEDTVWIEGVIQNRVTVAAGVLPDNPSTNADIILNGDISYEGVEDGSRVFAAIAQRHVLIPWAGADDILTLDGAFVAQQGRYGRRYYPQCCGAQSHALKTRVELFGMTTSNLIPVTTWVDSEGNAISGYPQTESNYDSNLLYGPPPYFPNTGQYQFLSWEQVE